MPQPLAVYQRNLAKWQVLQASSYWYDHDHPKALRLDLLPYMNEAGYGGEKYNPVET